MIPFAGNSNFANEIRNIIKVVSNNNASILLRGERGTGKRLFAQCVHYEKSKTLNGFFEVNCKSLNLNESIAVLENFIRDKSVAVKTIYINFIEKTDIEFQKFLLSSIKEVKEKGMNIRFICSTEINIEENLTNGLFLSDLFYQINNVVLNFLPLRQREQDIIPICEYYFNKFKSNTGIKFEKISDSAVDLLKKYYWKGNVDELINSIQRAFIVGELPQIKVSDLGINFNDITLDYSGLTSIENVPLKDAINSFKRYYVTKVLSENNWNQTKTARILGIQRTYVIKLINELQIRK